MSGRQIDRAALRYYTVMSMLLTPLGTSISMQRMTAASTDMMPRFGWDVTLRRGLCDALAEELALEIEPPHLPEPSEVAPSLVDYLTEHLELRSAPIADDAVERYELDTAIGSRTLQLESRIGAQLTDDDLDDMGAVLGRRPRDPDDGFARAERARRRGPRIGWRTWSGSSRVWSAAANTCGRR